VDHYLETGATRYYRVYVIDRHGAQCTGSNIVSVTAP